MVKIIVKHGKDNAKNRYRARRKAARDEAEKEQSVERKVALALNGGFAGLVAEKAIGGQESTDKTPAEDGSGGDAMHLIVNHAHQRSPKKKWS